MPSLNDIPFLGGYMQMDQVNRGREGQQLQQAAQFQTLQGAMEETKARQVAAQRDAQMRAALQGLPPDASQEQVAAAVRPFAGANQLLTSATASADRRAGLEAANINREEGRDQRTFELQERGRQRLLEIQEQAKQGRITKEEADARARQTRLDVVQAIAANRAPPAPRNLQITTDANGMQLIVNPDGTTRPLTTQDGQGIKKPVAADKPMTEFQGKAALYGTRAAQSDKVLKALEEKISATALSAAQGLGTVGNMMMTSEQRRVTQAQRDFVNAVLRQESGAVISDAEFDNAKKQYFPQPNDDAATINQKRANRKLAIEGFARMSGPKGTVDINAIIENPLLPGRAASPQSSSGKIRMKFDAEGNPVK